MEERLPYAQVPGEAERAAEDAAEDVAPPLVRGEDLVADHEGHGTQVISDRPVGGPDDVGVAIGHSGAHLARDLGDGAEGGGEDVGIEVGGHALQYGGQTLQA